MRRKILVFALLLSLISTLIPVAISAPLTTSAQLDTELNAMSDSVNSTFSIMQISDTQHLATLSPTLYNETTSWIVNNSANYNLQMVVHTGDFVDAFSTPPLTIYNDSQKAQEWDVANASMSKLLNAGVPYCWCAGNHDQTPFANPNGTSAATNYTAFNTTYLSSKSYWASDIYDSKNTAVKFTYNNYPFLIIDIENLANRSVLSWMTGLLDKNTGLNAIIATHDYLDANGKYDASSSTVSAWTKNFKTTLDSYPNVFLALCGHNHGWNMTTSGNRQEILFDFQEENSLTGAAAVRIYTFNLTNKQVYASTYCIDNKTWLTDAYNQFSFAASLTSDWTLINDARAVKAYPDLREYVWQKDARMQPNGQYDKIGLHRLVKDGIAPKGAVFIDPGIYGSGEQLISNPPESNYTADESSSQAIYWANRGFEVYSIDWRTHFLPQTMNASQASAIAGNWGWDVYINDMKEAVDKAKDLSGNSKIFLAGISMGGQVAMYYASEYWKQDLKGIIILDGTENPTKTANTTNTYNVTVSLNALAKIGGLAWETPRRSSTDIPPSGMLFAYQNALQNPGAPAEWPPGTPLQPTINPLTNKTWTNITEYIAYQMYSTNYSNIYEGYGNISVIVDWRANGDRYYPVRLGVETLAIRDWNNCPYVSFDFDDHYKEIDVPIFAVRSGLWGIPTYGNFTDGTANSDFTQIVLPKYGHLDIFTGPYSARDVSQPALDWMVNRLPTLTFGNTNVGAYQDGNDGQAKSASYFKCNNTGLVTDIFAYVARLGEAGDGAAAIYADNAGSPGALIAVTDEAIVGTDFSWVDFPLLSPVNVTAGMGYWLAVSSNNNLNMKIVMGSGVRVHNGVSSWFSDPFGSVWGTHDAGSMSIYAKGTGK